MSPLPHHPKVLTIGGATFDLFAKTEKPVMRIEAGSKIKVTDVIEACGGGASNAAVGLSRLGCSVSFAGVIGSDQWGEKLLQNFKKEKVDTKTATIVEGEVTSFSMIVNVGGGDRIIFYTPGTNTHLHDATFDRDKAKKMDWIYLTRLQDESCIIEDDIVAVLESLQGPKMTWNPGGCQIDHGVEEPSTALLLRHTTLLLLNREEALTFTRQTNIEDAHRLLHSMGVTVSCITNGQHGATAYDGKSLYRCAGTDTNIVDTTGAGDAFGVGMTWGLLTGKDLPNCLRAGTINALSVIGAVGAETALLTDTQMHTRLRDAHPVVEVLDALS